MTGEQVLRVILVKQLGGFSYDELAFHLADSLSYRAFCRLDIGHDIPNKKTLQRNIKKVEAITLERINVLLVEHAIAAKIDDGNKIRVGCTVMETNIHEPTDSSLLVDSVRVLTRLMTRARKYVESPFTNHHRLAKRRGLAILNARTQEDRVPLYQVSGAAQSHQQDRERGRVHDRDADVEAPTEEGHEAKLLSSWWKRCSSTWDSLDVWWRKRIAVSSSVKPCLPLRSWSRSLSATPTSSSKIDATRCMATSFA
jgi:IS5 family transposase